uniref:Uncharacterized protein n=1 Tax=Rhizophora mucronata TaxID=61149 RepID=A0A2P2P8F6_RHIMU
MTTLDLKVNMNIQTSLLNKYTIRIGHISVKTHSDAFTCQYIHAQLQTFTKSELSCYRH